MCVVVVVKCLCVCQHRNLPRVYLLDLWHYYLNPRHTVTIFVGNVRQAGPPNSCMMGDGKQRDEHCILQHQAIAMTTGGGGGGGGNGQRTFEGNQPSVHESRWCSQPVRSVLPTM